MRQSSLALACLAAGLLLGTTPPDAGAQQPTPGAATQAPQEGAMNVYLDCGPCDFDYLRTEITYVNWVRNRQDSDVHLLVTTQRTGGGGTEYALNFIGQRRLAGLVDTLVYAAPQNNTSDETRRAVAHHIKLGLVRYVARLGGAQRLSVTTGTAGAPGAPGAPGGPATPGGTPAQPARDRWNAWVFRASVNGFTNGEKTSEFMVLNGSVNASRTTAEWKLNFNANESYNESRFELSPTQTVVNIQRDYGFSSLAVKSLGAHWSAGVTSNVSSSVFLNQRLGMRVTPAVEWDLFPYAEATRRQLRVQYGAGLHRFEYRDTTIFLKTEETLPVHYLEVAFSMRQPWGSTNAGLNGSSYLNDPSKRRLSARAGASLRLVRGLNLNFNGSYSRINDQIYLKKGSATPEQVLLRQRQLQTSYRYSGSMGVSYSFGSIFNNVVNPRFGSSGGGDFIEFF